MFNIMKKTTIATFAALTLVSAVSAPAFAQTSNFNQRNQVIRQDNNNDQLVGGAIGAVVGGLIGSEVAGRGNGTEGAIVGALVGGVAGAAIANNGNNRRFSNNRSFNRGSSNRSQYGYYDYNYGYKPYSSYSNRRGFNNRGSFDSRRSFGGRSSFGKTSFQSRRRY